MLNTKTMKNKKLSFILILLLYSTNLFAQNQTNERAQWFTDARFGMFIHWGIYSGAEGFWKGEKLRNDNDYAEWIMYRNRIDKEEYLTLLDRFDWDEIDPEEWVILANKSGMKYVTITAKHHDGFGLWDSKVSDFDLGNYTDRDIIEELSEACKKHGLKLGLYYSHWVDWEHEFGWDHTKALSGFTSREYDKYWQEKVIPQVRELLTNYGDISMLWFDMWIHHSETIVTKQQLLQLKNLIRDLQPDCVVNSRLGLSIEEDPDVDYKTLGDNQLGSKKENFPWQSPATVAHSWGFHKSDSEWKSTSTLLKSLISNTSLNGNFMLNIGPRANGKVPYEISQRMLEMGEWLNVNGESIYGAEAFDLRKGMHEWGAITSKNTENGFKLYLHVYNWPLNKKLHLTGVTTNPEKGYLLNDKSQSQLAIKHKGAFTSIELPPLQPDNYISVLVVEYDNKPEIAEGLVAKTQEGGFALTPQNQISSNTTFEIQQKERRGTIPEHVIVKDDLHLQWKIYVDKPGTKTVDISYSFQNENIGKSKITVKLADNTLIHNPEPTGKTIGEPNRDWVIDNFASHEIGQIDFPEPGFYTIDVNIEPAENETINFQWIWLQ